jgi:phosphoglycolate phosphatase-like HAD superfamily hydrolase
MPKLILFDVDGTLIDSGGAGKAALEKTFEELTGIRKGFEQVHFAGNTDLAIIKAAFENHGVSAEDGLVARFLERYPTNLQMTVSRARGRAYPGVHELAAALGRADEHYLGLLTGNVQIGARIKLEPYGLNDPFPFGAFGDDNEDRNQLVPVAMERLESLFQVIVGYMDCLVIGDTPRDVACAAAWEARCLAVATGPYSVQELTDAGADLVVEDLSETDKIVQWVEHF